MASPRALISVWDKEGIEALGTALSGLGWQILSTGGTSRRLREAGIDVIDVSEATGHPEVFDGRVKTLHPAIHGGILARRDREDDMETLDDLGYGTIDLVCVNLYPFVDTAARDPPASNDELIEMIDIGGPTMVRSAAKNHSDVIILTNPGQYAAVTASLADSGGDPSGVDMETRQALALSAYQSTSSYDASVSNELERRFAPAPVPSEIHASSGGGTSLRYGENPHQPASFYPSAGAPHGLGEAIQHGGKPLSYNNYLDLDGALRLASNLIHSCSDHSHGCVVIKHTNPCGLGQAEALAEAWDKAFATDKQAPFGGIIACNTALDLATAEQISEIFTEVIVAPDFSEEALGLLQQKKNLRLGKLLLRSLKHGTLLIHLGKLSLCSLKHSTSIPVRVRPRWLVGPELIVRTLSLIHI